MKKSSFRLMVALVIMVVVLAACAGGGTGGASQPGGAGTPSSGDATGGNTTGGNAAGGGNAATQAPTEAATAAGGTSGTGGTGSGASAACAGVDTQQLVSTGQTFYAENCAGCHGEQGAGQGNFPALAGNANVTAGDVPALVQKYFAVDAHPKDITPDNLAAVLTYVRASFGNTAAAVCPTDIQIPAAK